MMISNMRVMSLGLLQAILLVSYQVCIKLTTRSFSEFSLSKRILVEAVLNNAYFWTAMILLLINVILWLYILNNYEFSRVYPLISLSYILAIPVSIFIFNESVPINRWVGVLIIFIGVCVVTRK